MVWYGVGSRNEAEGRTGLSHFLEHMMFKGTERFPYGVLEEGVKQRGGLWNAFTSYDYTAYYEVLPARHVAFGLEAEADRMAAMTFDPDLTVRERGIIVSEREGRENSPHYWLFEAFMQAAYQEFSYRHHVLGHKADIQATTAEALTEHYRRFYRPNNATLVVTGDVDADQVVVLANRHFGLLLPGEPVEQPVFREPEQTAERRVLVRRPGSNPYLMAGYKIPEATHPDHAALTLLASVLAGGPSFGSGGGASMGRSSRLYRNLVNRSIATSADGHPWSLQYPGLFLCSGTPVTGVALEKLEAALFAEVDALRQERVPDDEFARAMKQVRAQYLYGLESAVSQATMLGSSATTRTVEHFDRALERFEAVTPEDVLRVARTYLTPERRTVGWFEPEEGVKPTSGANAAPAVNPAPAAKPEPAAEDPAAAELPTTPAFQKRGHGAPPLPAAGGRARILDHERVVRRDLPGGAQLLVYPAATIPSAYVRVQLEAGAVHDPEGKAGLAQLTASLLTRGSVAFSSEELALKTDALGMSVRVDIGRETAVGTLKCLPEDLSTGLDILAEVLRRPTFPTAEVERMRVRFLVGLKEADTDTRSVAGRRLAELLYPERHPYRAPASGTPDSITGLSVADLTAFHRKAYGPAGAVVTVVGSVDPEQVCTDLTRALGGWTGGMGRPTIGPAPAPAAGRTHAFVDGKSQTHISLGWPLVDRSHPDFLALDFLATLFGGNGTPASSRLFRDVREKYGLSYYQSAGFGAQLGPAAWAVHMGVNPGRLEFALETVQSELERLAAEPAPPDELAGLKSFLEDYPAVQHESMERVAARLAELERFGLGLDYLERYPGLIRALTPEDLQAAARRHLRLEQVSIVTAGPEPDTH
jgi:zinc protease